DILKARGRGNIEMKITTLGDFNILGQYEIEDGDYLFTLQNIINKKFLLEKGGSITWNGDPYNATLDITALYKLKAPLYDILQDSSYKKRVPVDCRLKMTGKLASPSIAFDIDLPKSDEKIQSDVASAIGTQEEMNKQVFTLLMLNRFKSPGGATSSANRVGIGSSTTSELLSNQLTNWLSQISNDFDIGVDYRPGDEISSQELDVALSTQLFNDRMILEGNIGMSDNNNTGVSGNNSVAGDFSLEYKITDDGKLRAKVYNESNDQNIMNTNTAKYTQGAGISYREEFDTFGEFLRKIFRKKKKEAQR
ncbi:MAG: translocation/assembly module TamB domain-containing protein, partial [Flavobacteriales bacterium]